MCYKPQLLFNILRSIPHVKLTWEEVKCLELEIFNDSDLETWLCVNNVPLKKPSEMCDANIPQFTTSIAGLSEY